ncbi:mRNA-decapping enzyme 1A-like [Ctenocephalides felis]|uniref:mRNA-decapping enzyme 1A-like n=1 Tax=Ctenocephalides felis TaxID=7515 RepID=UPI000E6E2292|nr:mRNA-decapping enzyme 1A-like [Ctenocephalides felis]
MADVTELRMNVTALKRVDPYAKDIIETARHVAFYSFNSEENEWERTNIEGALFIYSRNGEPYHGILIINRLNTSNLVEPVVKGLDLQLQEPFLLYRNSNNCIRGFWFYDREDCVKVAQLLSRLIEDLQKQSIVPTENMISNGGAMGENSDIFTMLSRAQEDYHNQKKQPPTTQEISGAPKTDLTSQSVMDFFAKATTSSQNTLPLFAPRKAEPLNADPNILQRLMSNPAHSVEHIEKQQRCVTPQNNTGLNTVEAGRRKTNKVADIDKQHSLNENNLNFIRITSPNQISMKNAVGEESRPLSVPLNNTTNQTPALMPPTMFTSKTSQDNNYSNTLEQADVSLRPEPLTRNQLLQAVSYLLKTDSDFVNKLHEAYLKSFNDIVQ